VVALNGKANLLAKRGQLAEAIELYQSIPAKLVDQYTRCGLAFLLLKRNSGEKDITAAQRLFFEAEQFDPLNTVALLGLWISHARLGKAEEAERFHRRFEDCQGIQAAFSAEDTAEKEAVQQLEEIKCLITVREMALQAQYQQVIQKVFSYVLLHLSVRYQQRAFSFC
jgi:tetratricopeptide (TPR) repeat protein